MIPFGQEVVDTPGSSGGVPLLLNIVWLVSGGIWIWLTHLLFALLCALTIIGLPFAAQHRKLARLALAPFGKEIRLVE